MKKVPNCPRRWTLFVTNALRRVAFRRDTNLNWRPKRIKWNGRHGNVSGVHTLQTTVVWLLTRLLLFVTCQLHRGHKRWQKERDTPYWPYRWCPHRSVDPRWAARGVRLVPRNISNGRRNSNEALHHSTLGNDLNGIFPHSICKSVEGALWIYFHHDPHWLNFT